MRLLARILALFLIMPVVELFLLIQLEEWADTVTDDRGLLFTLGLIFVTGVAGSYLAKQQGLSIWRKLNERLSQGGLPGKELMDGVIILIAGALLITPGVITDFVGFMGLIPFTRAPIRRYALKRIRRAMDRGTMSVTFGPFGSATYSEPSHDDEVPPTNGWQGEARESPSYSGDRPRPSDEG